MADKDTWVICETKKKPRKRIIHTTVEENGVKRKRLVVSSDEKLEEKPRRLSVYSDEELPQKIMESTDGCRSKFLKWMIEMETRKLEREGKKVDNTFYNVVDEIADEIRNERKSSSPPTTMTTTTTTSTTTTTTTTNRRKGKEIFDEYNVVEDMKEKYPERKSNKKMSVSNEKSEASSSSSSSKETPPQFTITTKKKGKGKEIIDDDEYNVEKGTKKKYPERKLKKKSNGNNEKKEASTSKEMPQLMREAIRKQNGTKITWITEKTLVKTDIKPDQGRLLITNHEILLAYLTDNEREKIKVSKDKKKEKDNNENQVKVIDHEGKEWELDCKKWENGFTVLTKGWNTMVESFKMKVDDKVQLWCFREPVEGQEDSKLCFAINVVKSVIDHEEKEEEQDEATTSIVEKTSEIEKCNIC